MKSVWTSLYSHQWCMGALFSLYPCPKLILSDFKSLAGWEMTAALFLGFLGLKRDWLVLTFPISTDGPYPSSWESSYTYNGIKDTNICRTVSAFIAWIEGIMSSFHVVVTESPLWSLSEEGIMAQSSDLIQRDLALSGILIWCSELATTPEFNTAIVFFLTEACVTSVTHCENLSLFFFWKGRKTNYAVPNWNSRANLGSRI